MAQNSVQDGEIITYVVPNATTITAGQVVVIGNATGIALTGGTTGDEIEVMLEGVFIVAKATPLVIAQGDRLFFDTGNSRVTKTATHRPFGVAFRAAGSNDTTVAVRLYAEGVRFNPAANVAAVATANATDLATAQALANANKTAINAILTALKNGGLMVPD